MAFWTQTAFKKEDKALLMSDHRHHGPVDTENARTHTDTQEKQALEQMK